MKVKECMCNNAVTCMTNSTVYDVAKLMQTDHVGCVPVCENEETLVGIVTDRDIVLRCIACDKDVKQTPVSEIMTADVCTCNADDEMTNAQSMMGNKQIRRLPVLENGKIVGMLTLGDLARNDIELGQEEVSDTINNICDSPDGENQNAE